MSLLLDGLRCKKNSFTPEYRLTKLIFEFRQHPTPYHALKAGFEVPVITDQFSLPTLQAAVDARDWAFLDAALLRHDPDISALRLPGFLIDRPYDDRHARILMWQGTQQHNKAARVRNWKRNLFFAGCSVVSLWNFSRPPQYSPVMEWTVLVASVGLHFCAAVLNYENSFSSSYKEFKERMGW